MSLPWMGEWDAWMGVLAVANDFFYFLFLIDKESFY